jgi:ferredoxin-fold anticodon binding domain-containing protein
MTFQEQVLDIVYTDYYQDKSIKEDKLKNIFNYYGKEYDRDKVKDIVYNKYKGIGGYKDKEAFTNWIF